MAVTTGGPRRVKLIDATLREGAQAPSVQFTAEQTAEIAALLRSADVDTIECGHAAVSEEERERIRWAVEAAGDVPVLVHARACRPDVDATAETGASAIGIFLGFNEHSQRARVVGASQAETLDIVSDTVAYAAGLGLAVRFTVEDASRTDRATLAAAYGVAEEAGADRLCFADTVGCLEPAQVAAQVAWMKETFAAPVEVHLHDDRGLALANALAAVDAGATWISTSVNGLGERAGIPDLFAVAANLHVRGDREVKNPKALRRLGELVGAVARSRPDARRPVIGANAFTHTARLHRRAIERDRMAYSWIAPEVLDRDLRLFESTRWAPEDLVLEPQIRSATELPHHRHGPGDRYLLIDDRKLAGCGQYCIVRYLPGGDPGEGHVDEHRHTVDSLFVFMGMEDGLTGLSAVVTVDDTEIVIESPATVFIPAGVRHRYRVVGGRGLFVNHVSAGTYAEGLLE